MFFTPQYVQETFVALSCPADVAAEYGRYGVVALYKTSAILGDLLALGCTIL